MEMDQVLHGKERPGALISVHPCLALRSAPWQPDTAVIELSDRVVKLCGVQRVPDVGYRDGKRVVQFGLQVLHENITAVYTLVGNSLAFSCFQVAHVFFSALT